MDREGGERLPEMMIRWNGLGEAAMSTLSQIMYITDMDSFRLCSEYAAIDSTNVRRLNA